ncbi:DUF3307 domain-containing protein [Sphingobacterium deserti]|uniref:DUF3307 domain-containing protein n=1 Tax=Sphingobacterium deserti TaxID=1229276 RepID=A0A0B8T6F8_9SPHI|nr:DUF3307 domain-containing protein [Sphingobacterium deserti]KGE12775.1 hypothetical protein DI53_3514 [Sphingobacterium deserti]
MSIIFLKLLLAHLLGDFVFQPNRLVQMRKEKIGFLLLHVAIHGLLLSLLFCTTLSTQWHIVLFVTFAHLLIDSVKIYLEKKWPLQPFVLFIFDQILHVASIIAALVLVYGWSEAWTQALFSSTSLCYLIAFLLTAFVSPIALRVFFSKWTSQTEFLSKPQDSLTDAGLLIGIMERLLIVLFVQIGFLSGIGFLLGAKSIFRFGDLTKARDTKFTEYILIGTFASFIVGILIGYALKFGLKYLTISVN